MQACEIEREGKECCCLLRWIGRRETLQGLLVFNRQEEPTYTPRWEGKLVLEVLGIWIHSRLSLFPFSFRMIYILIWAASCWSSFLYLNLFTSCPINQLFQALRVWLASLPFCSSYPLPSPPFFRLLALPDWTYRKKMAYSVKEAYLEYSFTSRDLCPNSSKKKKLCRAWYSTFFIIVSLWLVSYAVPIHFHLFFFDPDTLLIFPYISAPWK